ncbi:MarR family winged helix-turn-helix transcriptional regulator [Rhodococcus sp. ACPA1]|uniref:MarR family winged helix-turn-helix transcriptional regulator n=1 Tax=Rhodococcus sp. ACPA1 TaxID=2028572 RepID=UPI00211BEA69|nr:MarR family transcriptional regulator [Rhodococcus sp. ACPA1]
METRHHPSRLDRRNNPGFARGAREGRSADAEEAPPVKHQSNSERGSGDGQDLGPSLLYAIKQLELAIRSRMDTILRPAGITALQYTALTVLRRCDGLSSAELARNSFVTAQTMGEMIIALESRGLVSRRVDPSNRRQMLTSVTATGVGLLDCYHGEVSALEEQMVSQLTPRQRGTLREYLISCRAGLTRTEAH